MGRYVRGAGVGAVVAVCLLPALSAGAEKAPANAALTYWQAFAMMPQITPKQAQQVSDFDKVELGEEMDKLVASHSASLRLLHRAAAMKECAWGLALDEDGLNTLLPHVDRGYRLVRVALLRARQRFEGADPRGGVADAVAAMTLGRHLGTDKLPISFLVQRAIDRKGTELLARHLPAVPAGDRAALVKRLEGLPVGATLRDALEMEKAPTSVWVLKRLEGLRKDPMWKEKVLELLAPATYPEPEKRQREVKKMLESAGGVGALIGYVKEVEKAHDAIIRLADRTPEQAAKELKPLLAARKNPMWGLLMPGTNYAVLWEREAEAKVRLAMLKAAVAVQGGTVEALKAHPDPYGKVPFTHKAVAGGFELSSGLKVKGEAVTLRVGPGK